MQGPSILRNPTNFVDEIHAETLQKSEINSASSEPSKLHRRTCFIPTFLTDMIGTYITDPQLGH